MEKHLISIIITTFNRLELLKDAIVSVQGQNFNDYELIVVNDGSTDGTKEYLDSRQDIKSIYIEENKGSTNALNVGLREAKGEYICILDDDDIWTDSNKLKKQFEFLEANQDYVVVGTNAEVAILDEVYQEVKRVITKYPLDDKEIRENFLLNDGIAHSSAMYRRKAVMSFGGYDKSLERSKDWDLFLKLGLIGKLANLPDNTVFLYEKRQIDSKLKDSKFKLKIIWRHKKEYPHFFRATIIEFIRFCAFLILKKSRITKLMLNINPE